MSKKEYNSRYYENNKDKVLEKAKEYYLKNKETLIQKSKEHRGKNKEIILKKQREYYLKNREKILEKAKLYGKINRDNILEKKKEYQKENKIKIRLYKNSYHKKRLKEDVLYKLYHTVRHRVKSAIKKNNFTKKSQTYKLLGCSFEELKSYFESKFEPWMTWDNHGLYNGKPNYGWDVDHIIPISSVNSEEELLKLFHHTNLQPLCSYKNRYIKKDKL